MEFFRSHIVKIPLLLLIITGITFFVWPREDRKQTGESVSVWLMSLRADTDNQEVQNKIYSLRGEQGDIPGLLRKASDIIGQHQDDFTLPVDDSGATNDDIYNTLLLKWTLYQQETLADTVVIIDRQIQVPPASEKDDKTLWNQVTSTVQFVIGAYSRLSDAIDYIRMILRPLAGGISINAP
jgi:hypothetical protein